MENNRFYVQINLADYPEILTARVFKYQDKLYSVPSEILEDISKQSGISSTVMKILGNQDPDLLAKSIIAGCEYYYKGNLILLIQNDEVIRVSFNKYVPLLNHEFIQKMKSILQDYQDIVTISCIRECEEFSSSVTIYPTSEFTYKDTSYNLGVLFENNELDTISCKLVVRSGDLEFYLPSKYFNLSASRYMRSSVDMKEALSQLMLRVLESMNDRERWFSIIMEVDMKLRDCQKIYATYEEYKSILRLLNTISGKSDMDDEEYGTYKSALEDEFLEDFATNYPAIDEKKGSYIWRCSAIGDNTIYSLITHVLDWKVNKIFYPICDEDIMSLIGEFIMSDRISTHLARRK